MNIKYIKPCIIRDQVGNTKLMSIDYQNKNNNYKEGRVIDDEASGVEEKGVVVADSI
jgi:hypothetical protein